jgi:hypothetical protein
LVPVEVISIPELDAALIVAVSFMHIAESVKSVGFGLRLTRIGPTSTDDWEPLHGADLTALTENTLL